jgi:hypothetical protein
VAVLSLLGFVMQILPGLDQRNAQIIALAVPIHLALAWTVRRLADKTRAAAQPVPAKAATREKAAA